ncbi:speckle-type POZ protein B-like [Microplitis mediator]|uniref:speckle-type POZ protein B-like n=1 Tax=Microplitis mediator TaxID=375433 RepID=UPI0025577022|nr:speckle-type POZ protein B-like [Microplitis mediator]
MDIQPEECWSVSHEWKAVVLYGIDRLYSNQFKIKNIEDIAFTIGMKMNEQKTHFEVWVQKSNVELLKASIHLSVKDKCAKTKVVDEWKDICSFKNFLLFPSQVVARQAYDFNGRALSHNVYDVTINCKIVLHDYMQAPMFDNLYEDLQQFLKSQELSDVTLVVGEVEIPAHKVVLAAHSPVFKAMLLSGMKEAKQGEIEIKNVDADIISEMLEYFYKGETKASFDTEVALKMIELADIYQIEKLKNICQNTLLNNMSIDNIFDIVDVADDHNIEELRDQAIKFMVKYSDRVFALKRFEQLFYKKSELMFELMTAVGKKK